MLHICKDMYKSVGIFGILHSSDSLQKKIHIQSFSSLCFQFSSVQSLSCVRLFATPRTAAHQASLSITNSWSLVRLISIELVIPSSHLILCRPLLLLSQLRCLFH